MTLTKQLQVFLLYSRGDRQAVRRLHSRMVKAGAKAWLDEKNILPGQDWQAEIRKAIYRSDIVIVCLSRQFNKQGGYRHEELKIALQKAESLLEDQIFIVPVSLEECDMPEPLCRWQRIDLFTADGYKKLLNVLQRQCA